MTPLRVGFAGTPAFAAEALAAILAAGHPVPVVLTQPDRPQGRGLKLAAPPVKELALRHALPVLQPATLRTPDARAGALAIPIDVLVVAAYGLILPAEVLAWPRHGGINIHASKLPRWRGAAPIQRAILAGDTATGVTIMQMDEGLDTGPMLAVVDVPIAPRETAGTLTTRLAAAGAEAIVRVLARIARGDLPPAVAQPADGATYAAKVGRDDARLDWTLPATALDRAVRAFDPVPGAYTEFDGAPLTVRSAEPAGAGTAAPPGTVTAVGAGGIDVCCGEGALRLLTVQPAGGKRMGAGAFAAGRALLPGVRFGAARPLP